MKINIFYISAFLVLSIALILNSQLYSIIKQYFFQYNDHEGKTNNSNGKLRLFTSDELKLYNGIDRPEMYLVILGKVFDVTKGGVHYAPGKTYNIFIGRDSSRSFVSGQFNIEDADDKVADLDPEDIRSLRNWVKFYKKDYNLIGKLIGRYYNEDGELTPYGKLVREQMNEAENAKKLADELKKEYPPCNVQWDAESGTKVWCTNKSGGVHRDWEGVPRQLYSPETKDYRCVCVAPDQASLNTQKFREYTDCDRYSNKCFYKN